MKNAIIVFVLGICVLSSIGCGHPTVCVIQPIVENSQEQKRIIDLSAKLEKLQVSGDLKTDFSNTSKQTFDKLSDANVALLLCLNAVDCYLQRGKAGEALAQQLVQMVREEYAAKKNLRGVETTLSPVEKNMISESPHSFAILSKLRGFGIQ